MVAIYASSSAPPPVPRPRTTTSPSSRRRLLRAAPDLLPAHTQEIMDFLETAHA
ncbi:hypothetical protein [Nonomuraea sp. NPDC003201]